MTIGVLSEIVSIALQSQSRDVHAVLRIQRVASHFTRTESKTTATTTLHSERLHSLDYPPNSFESTTYFNSTTPQCLRLPSLPSILQSRHVTSRPSVLEG